MYRNILMPIDNSPDSNSAAEIAIRISKCFNSTVTGLHVYAAKMHDMRFRQMENGLPDRYQVEEELERQREVHDTLISKGLNVISDSYLDAFEEGCRRAKVRFERKSVEGKNYRGILDELGSGNYDLVVMGALGLGAVENSLIGSVCERVVRRTVTDVLVVRENLEPDDGGHIVVAVDGSANSYGGFRTAISLSKAMRLNLEAASVFDPFFHDAAFQNIARVLSEKAEKIFRFKEQEKLHEEIINGGLAKIYRRHLEACERIARKEGALVRTHLLQGKPFEEILRHIRRTEPWLVVVGRVGVHDDGSLDIGNTTENLLRLSPCNILISGSLYTPPPDVAAREAMAWTQEAERRLLSIPSFAREMAKGAIDRFASERGHTVVTSDLMDRAVRELLPPSMRQLMGIPTTPAEDGHPPDSEEER